MEADEDPHVLLGRVIDAATDLAHMTTRKLNSRFSCTCRFTRTDEFSAATLIAETECGYHATMRKEPRKFIRKGGIC